MSDTFWGAQTKGMPLGDIFCVRMTFEPMGRGAIGGASGGASMLFFHPTLYLIHGFN
jgi:hypothetical protein